MMLEKDINRWRGNQLLPATDRRPFHRNLVEGGKYLIRAQRLAANLEWAVRARLGFPLTTFESVSSRGAESLTVKP